MESLIEKLTYLGDGVYTFFDGYHHVLRTDTHVVFLDPDVTESFLRYLKKFKKEVEQVNNEAIP